MSHLLVLVLSIAVLVRVGNVVRCGGFSDIEFPQRSGMLGVKQRVAEAEGRFVDLDCLERQNRRLRPSGVW